MSQYTVGPVKTFTAGEDIGRYVRVKVDTTSTDLPIDVLIAGPGDNWIGVTREEVSSGDPVGVILKHMYGTLPMVAAGAVSKGATAFPAPAGRVSGSGDSAFGTVIVAATAAGDIVEVVFDSDQVMGGSEVYGFEDDFHYYVTADMLSTTATNSGTATVSDGVKGILNMAPSDGSVVDNDEIYVHNTAEVFLFAASKPLYLKAIMSLTEANTNDANWMIGVMNGVAADSLLDNGGGPKADYSGAVFFKVDGTMEIVCEASISTTQDTSASADNLTFVSGTTYTLELFFQPTSSTAASVFFYINGTLYHTATITYTGATEMAAVLACKNGDANNESLDVDYLGCWQTR